MWEALPLICYGYAVHPLIPSTRRDTRYSTRTHRTSGVTDASADDLHRDIVSLEVGDEIYAFEKYTPKGKETDGIWYRGYVVCTTRRPPVTWALSGDASSSKSTPKIEEPQQVFIGIFPASHVYVRDELSDAEGRLQTLASSMENGSQTNGHSSSSVSDSYSQWSRSNFSTAMSVLREEDEEFDTASIMTGVRLPRLDQASLSHAGIPVYSSSRSARSLRSSSPAESQVMMKPLPPRPSLKSGDDTASGALQPIVDEIASALREWHIFLFQYLARRDYRLFQVLREHIEALHLGRRQLLAQTLNEEETVSMRRDCVVRLVKGNLVQGLDVIVRHPSWGGLVTVEIEGEIDSRTWVSAVRMYSMQVTLAYLNLDDLPLVAPTPAPLPTPAHSAFPEFTHRARMKSIGRHASPSLSKPPAAKFYHILLDLRAFVASFCSPGETAELLFSLYRLGSHAQSITEDFCATLNHNGVLARNPSARIRTLFTDLSLSDLSEPIYLVCRVVRNGSLKIGTTFSSGVPAENGRRGSESRLEPNAVTPWTDTYAPVSPGSPRVYPSSDNQFRRPFGCAVLELSQLAQMAADDLDVHGPKEYAMPIYVPTNETTFSMLHQNIIDHNMKEFEKSSRAEMLAVSIKVYRGDANTIVKENTSVLLDTPHTLRLGFPDVVFPGDVRNELYIKLWSGSFQAPANHSSRISVGNITRGGPPPMNMQVTIEVRDELGRTMEGAISKGSGEPFLTYFHSMVFQRCHEPTFGELIKLQLPLDGIPSWHLFFTFRIRSARERAGSRPSEKLDPAYAFAFLPLYPEKRAFVEDGAHNLVMYRADKLSQVTPEQYLSSPCCLLPNQKPESLAISADMQRNAPALRDSLVIRSSLCSTKYTQNPVLLNLLNWEKVSDKEILSQVLTAFTFVGEVEIVKFLRDIFDSLFGILVSPTNQNGDMDHLVFNAIVIVLGIVQDRRFSNFRPVIDLYIQQHFTWAAASSHIIHSMNRLLANPATTDNATQLREALKVWHYIIKFIARSPGATAEHLEATFKRELRSHLTEVNRMMSSTTPASIIGTQTIALQNFTSILPELAKIFSNVDLVSIVTTFASTAVAASKGKIVIWKLIMYLQIVKGFLFDNPESRPLLVEAVVLWIKPHFGRYDEYVHTQSTDSETARDSARIGWLENIRLCVTIIAVMLDKLQTNLVSPEVIQDRRRLTLEKDNVECLLPLLPRLLDSYREYMSPESARALERTPVLKTTVPVVFPESYPFSLLIYLPRSSSNSRRVAEAPQIFNSGLAEAAVVLLVLILSSPPKAILDFLESSLDIEGRDRFITLLSHFFKVSTSILENECFPKTWLNINILAHQVLVKMMGPVEAFTMLLKLLSSEQLCIEEFSPQKRRAVWRLAGDIRGDGASIMITLWQALGWGEHSSTTGEPAMRFGGYQVYLNTVVGSVVALCLSHHEQLRNNAVQMLYSMIVSEYHQSGNFEDIENELVTRLDYLFMSESSKDDISGFFVSHLRHLFVTSEVDEQLRERVSNFLDSVDLFLELLLSVRALPEGDEFADERVIATLRLMNFIRRIGRDEIYIKYVHQLVNMHLQSQNYVEAALTLKLHSDLYPWDLNSFVPPMEELGLPQQSKFHRKETLCLLILDYLGKGKAWERAIDICTELASQHSGVTFNYGRLSEILRHQANLLEHIVTDQRYYSDYYLVTFYGNFPAAIRDKRFIYRGYEWEKYAAFCERMLNKHSGAQLLKIVGDPPVDIRFGNEQFIQCTSVIPEPNRDAPVFANPDVPVAVRTYYEHSAINLFSTSRPVKRIARDGTEEVWIEKVYFTTEETFPTVLRRSQVVDIAVMDISPIENALSEVAEKTKELSALNLRYQNLAKTAQEVSTNALSMVLNSAVDAPLNTGISAFRQMFFTDDWAARNPEQVELAEKLRAAIDEQARIIDSCLKLHGSLCPPEFVPFHETLERFFRKNFREEIHRLGIDDVSDTLTKSPSLKSHATANPQFQYQPSYNASSIARSISLSSSRRPALPPLQLGPTLSPPPLSPNQLEAPAGPLKQTPLQRHLAHLTRHGINGVSSGPNDAQNGSDSFSVESPHDSFVNVGNGIHALQAAQTSGASVATSNFGGSLGSLNSLKGRFSRFGSLNFGRRNNA
ncbi:cytoplasmic protein [Gymnopus androsaceus JB14]|uniref:Cytoplasmic protein n=1 Tax=Gymnopus androsaceus JB14 TaxID=1447944 RepID=A0A6A4HXB7_9AGAR|nr:cytoplasmic protein [Gymnopus androsaceus JB14]